MSTAAATLESSKTAKAATRYLYFGTALLFMGIVYLAFTRTFWSPLVSGALALHPAIILHATVAFLWTALFVVQTWLPLTGRTALHRDLGMFGVALAAILVCSGLLAAIVSLQAGLPGPRPEAARTGAVLSFSGMTLFTTFFALAIANLRRLDYHKRFMVLASFSILQAAVARFIMLFPAIAQPQRVVIGAIVVDVLIAAVALLDARARGRVHPVYIAGGAFIVVVQYLRVQLLGTDAWAQFCAWLAALGT